MMAPPRAEWTDLMGAEQCNKGRTVTSFSRELYENDASQESGAGGGCCDILRIRQERLHKGETGGQKT